MVLERLDFLTDFAKDSKNNHRFLDDRVTSLEHDRIRFKLLIGFYGVISSLIAKWVLDHGPSILKKLVN